jgi:hypothetical protein
MTWLGLGVTIHALGGDDGSEALLKGRVGKIITGVYLDAEENRLVFSFKDGLSICLFDAGQSCCEARWMHTDDELSDFAGSTFLGAEVRDGPETEVTGEVKESQFLIVKTSLGEFTVVNYNEHNGYYGGFWLVAKVLDE